MGGSLMWVTLLGNIIIYRSCGVGGPNSQVKNFQNQDIKILIRWHQSTYKYTLFAIYFMINSGMLWEQKKIMFEPRH